MWGKARSALCGVHQDRVLILHSRQGAENSQEDRDHLERAPGGRLDGSGSVCYREQEGMSGAGMKVWGGGSWPG